MYFASRTEAGKMLAEQIAKSHTGDDCAVIGLSDGSVITGAQIALRLHAPLGMLLVEPIELPREGIPIGGISDDGSFAYNGLYSPGEVEELVSEYYHYIEGAKARKLAQMHELLGRGGLVRKDLLHDKVVILVSDGLISGFSLDVAAEFLKTVKYKKLIIATPLASVPAVDRMHVLGDEIYCLTVVQDFITTDHYYDLRDVPPHDVIVRVLERIMRKWKPSKRVSSPAH
jgi:putative phosphoribosyl transferase